MRAIARLAAEERSVTNLENLSTYDGNGNGILKKKDYYWIRVNDLVL